MKKLLAIAVVALSLGACHYGTEEAEKTLETNSEYKAAKADYSVNRANVTAAEEAPAAEAAPADTTAKP